MDNHEITGWILLDFKVPLTFMTVWLEGDICAWELNVLQNCWMDSRHVGTHIHGPYKFLSSKRIVSLTNFMSKNVNFSSTLFYLANILVFFIIKLQQRFYTLNLVIFCMSIPLGGWPWVIGFNEINIISCHMEYWRNHL